MEDSADPDQMASGLDLHCLSKDDISGFSRTRRGISLLLLFIVKHVIII